MKNPIIPEASHKYLAVGALLWAFITPGALAQPAQDTELAEKEFARGNLIVAMTLWRKAAQLGYAPAQARMGDILDKAEEDVEAVDWYRKAAEQANAAGEYGLGQMYLKGEGVKKDVEQARSYILRAAQKNHLEAVVLMMEAYRNGGLGLAADPAQADDWEAKLIVHLPGYQRASEKDAAKVKK